MASSKIVRNDKEKPKREKKVMDTMLDAWYFNEINKRINEDVQLFRNYQINPYTKKSLDNYTPKITERRQPLPECPDDTERCRSFHDTAVVKNYKMIKCAVNKSINPPRKKFCKPQTEAMRLGWFDLPPPPANPVQCMYIKTCWSDSPCFYFHPKLQADQSSQNEMYDERFRATHRTAEFIHTASKLRAYDAIMNPKGSRGGLTKSPVVHRPK